MNHVKSDSSPALPSPVEILRRYFGYDSFRNSQLEIIEHVLQRKHAILKNFPVIGHFRYWLETIGPELRQYIVTSNNEERPFSRDERSWVYASSKKQNNYSGFGTDDELELFDTRRFWHDVNPGDKMDSRIGRLI